MAELKDEKEKGVSSVMVHFICGHRPQNDTWNGGSRLPITSVQQETRWRGNPTCLPVSDAGEHRRQSLDVTLQGLPTSLWRCCLLGLDHAKPHQNGVSIATRKSNPLYNLGCQHLEPWDLITLLSLPVYHPAQHQCASLPWLSFPFHSVHAAHSCDVSQVSPALRRTCSREVFNFLRLLSLPPSVLSLFSAE